MSGARDDRGSGRPSGSPPRAPAADARRARREYRRLIDSETWHFCSNCVLWPADGFESVVNDTPVLGELCTLCIGLKFAGACEAGEG